MDGNGKIHNHKIREAGQTLMELLLALGIFAFIMTAVFALVFGGLTTGLRSEEQDYATMFAQEGLDAARSIRDKDWDTFITANDAPNMHGVSTKNGKWEWKNASNQDLNDTTSDVSRNEITQGARKYTREITVENVGRVDTNGDSIPDDIFTGTNYKDFDFNSSAGYDFDLTKIEFADNAAKLKLQTPELAGTEANLKALYHFNSTTGAEANREGDELDIGTPGVTTDDDLGVGVLETNLKGLWHLNETIGTSAPDVAGINNGIFPSNPGWTAISISNTGSALASYQIKVTVNTQSLITNGWMRNDCNDIRFKADTNAASLDMNYWLESGCNTPSTIIWVKVPSVPTGTTAIYMHYNTTLNPTWTASLSNGGNTFVFFDDFPGTTLNTTNWPGNSFGVNLTISGGIASVKSTGAAWQGLSSSYSLASTATTVLETKYKTAGTNNMHLYFEQTSNRFAIQPYLIGLTGPRVQYRVSAGSYLTGGQYTTTSANTWYIHRIDRQSSTVFRACTYNDTYGLLGSCSSQTQAGWSTISFSFNIAELTTQTSNFDWVRVRQYAATEPTVAVQTNPTWTTAGKFSNALSFDGVDDYVSAANESNFDFDRTQPFSLEAWVKTSATSGEIVSKMNNASPYTGYELNVTTGGVLHTYLISNWAAVPAKALEVTGSIPVNNNAWHHVALTYDGSSSASGLKFYVDGVLDPLITIVKNNLTAPDSILNNINLAIGSRNGQIAYFNGSIDEVSIYNTALTAPQITDHYRRGVAEDAKTPDPLFEAKDGNTYGPITIAGNTGLGQALSFDGTDDYVSLPSPSPTNLNFSAPTTVEGWVKTNNDLCGTLFSVSDTASNNNYQTIQIGNNCTGALVNELITIMRKVSGTSIYTVGYTTTNRSELMDNQWHHIAVTFDGAIVKIYIDGNPKTVTVGGGSNNGTYGAITNPTDASIGSWAFPAGNRSFYFKGSLDEVAIWNTALPPATIAAHASTVMGYPSSAEITTPPSGVLSDLGSFKDFTETVVLPAGTSIDYSISTDGCTTMQYWDGNNWSTAGGWNDTRTINRYFSFLGAGLKNLCLKARLNTTNSNQTPSLDNIKINYNQTGGTNNIHTKKITSRVKWNNGLALQDISLSEYLTDWMYGSWTQTTYNDFYCPSCSAETLEYLGSASPDDAAQGGVTTLTPNAWPHYTSNAFDTGSDSHRLIKLVWNEDAPSTTEIRFNLCTSPSSGFCLNSMGPGGTNNGNDYFSRSSPGCSKSGTTVTCLISSTIEIGDGVNDRYITYIFALVPDFPAYSQAPTLYDVSIQYKEIY